METADMEPLASLISKAFEDERLYGKAKQEKESEWDHVIRCEHGVRKNKCKECEWLAKEYKARRIGFATDEDIAQEQKATQNKIKRAKKRQRQL